MIHRTDKLPTTKQMDPDGKLRSSSVWQRWSAIGRPFMFFGGYVLAHILGFFALGEIFLALSVSSGISVWHDLVHSNLSMTSKRCHAALFVVGLYLLQSGHAYRATHLWHHKVFPEATLAKDPEGWPALQPFWKVLLWGLIFWQYNWVWAYRKFPHQRLWFIAELLGSVTLWITGLWLWFSCGWTLMLYYLATVQLLDCLADLLFVKILHLNFVDDELRQAITVRGRLIPDYLLFGTWYHLEHHLYPTVPIHHLRELAERLDPIYEANNIKPWKLP